MNKIGVAISFLIIGLLSGYVIEYYFPLASRTPTISTSTTSNRKSIYSEFWNCDHSYINKTLECRHYIPEKVVKCDLEKLKRENKTIWEGC
ncbi:MAG: hypothetical protein AAB922_00605 [Patescibacteria group bacterium]